MNMYTYTYSYSSQVDFALCTLASPAHDLFMLLHGSSHVNVTPAEWDALIQQYHTELNQMLKLLSYSGKVPTLLDVHVAMLTRVSHLVPITLYIVGLRNMEISYGDIVSKILDPDDSNENQRYRMGFFSNQKCVNEMRYLLKFFDRRGLLDHFK